MAASGDSSALARINAASVPDLVRTSAPAHKPGPRQRIVSTDILRGCDEIEIDHRGMLYRLRITSLGKLILTK